MLSWLLKLKTALQQDKRLTCSTALSHLTRCKYRCSNLSACFLYTKTGVGAWRIWQGYIKSDMAWTGVGRDWLYSLLSNMKTTASNDSRRSHIQTKNKFMVLHLNLLGMSKMLIKDALNAKSLHRFNRPGKYLVEKAIEGYQIDKTGILLRKSPKVKLVGRCKSICRNRHVGKFCSYSFLRHP